MYELFEKTANETMDHYEQKMDDLYKQIKRLTNENKGLKGRIRGFRRSIRQLKNELADEQKKNRRQRPQYRNGKRGTRFNG